MQVQYEFILYGIYEKYIAIKNIPCKINRFKHI